ncbi:hypothetical protein FKM82_005577 [Ascaphus truei]
MLLCAALLLPLLGVSSLRDPRPDPGEELLLCKLCGFEVAGSGDLHFSPSPVCLSRGNATVTIGERKVPVQLLGDPAGGERHYVVTLRRAAVHKHWPARDTGSWFPGFSWVTAKCPRCLTRLGWAYQPESWRPFSTDVEFEDSDDTFVALIIDELMQETFSPSMIEMSDPR